MVWAPRDIDVPLLEGSGHDGEVRGVAFRPFDADGPDGPYHVLASVDVNGVLQVFHLGDESRNQVRTLPAAGLCCAWVGDLVMVGLEGKDIAIFDPRREPLGTAHVHDASVLTILPLADGRLLTGASNGVVHLWDGHPGGTPLATFRAKGLMPGIWGASAGADGRIALACARSMVIWDPDADKVLTTVQTGMQMPVYAVAWSHDQHQVAVGVGSQVHLVDPHTGQTRAALEAHRANVNDIVWLDADRVLSCGDDDLLVVWELWDGSHRVLQRSKPKPPEPQPPRPKRPTPPPVPLRNGVPVATLPPPPPRKKKG